jgi:hypothetical protein
MDPVSVSSPAPASVVSPLLSSDASRDLLESPAGNMGSVSAQKSWMNLTSHVRCDGFLRRRFVVVAPTAAGARLIVTRTIYTRIGGKGQEGKEQSR